MQFRLSHLTVKAGGGCETFILVFAQFIVGTTNNRSQKYRFVGTPHSGTRFGKIFSLWRNFKILWQPCLKAYLVHVKILNLLCEKIMQLGKVTLL